MRLTILAIAIFVGYLLFLYTFQSGKTIYVISEEIIPMASDTTSSNLGSFNVQAFPSMTVTVEVKRGKTFGIFPNAIYFYIPKISNGVLYFKEGEIIVEKFHYIIIFLVVSLIIADFLLRRKNIYTYSYNNLWKESYF